MEQHAAPLAALSAASQQQLASYKQQHEAFVQHALQQIQQLQQQLELCHGKVGQLAKRVGMERTHLYRKLRSLGIDFKSVGSDD